MSTSDSYSSSGTMKVESNALVADLTGTQRDPGFGWQTPAGATADSFNALLRTGTFVDAVAVNAGLEDALDTGTITADQVRGSISVYPDGARLVKVAATNQFPDVTHRLATAAMTTYIEAVIANEVSDSRVAIEFLEQKLPDYEAAVADAEAAFDRWLAQNPAPEDGERPEDQAVELTRLQTAITTREQQLADGQRSIEQAELSVEQKSAEVEQRLQVIDPPQEPFAPQPKTKKAVLTVVMALVLGSLLTVAGVVIGTILDRTIRFPGDVKERLNTRMLAVVPRTRLTPAIRKRFETQEVAAPAIASVPSGEDVDDSPRSPVSALPVDKAADNGAVATQPAGDVHEAPPRPTDTRASAPLTRVP